MINSLIEIGRKEFLDNVKVRFNNILDGLDSFPNLTLDFNLLGYDEDRIIEFINKVFDYNDGEVYIDFYINRLTENDKANILELADEGDKNILRELVNLKASSDYFKLLSKELIPVFTRLNTREIFFMTFYFTKKSITIWGNYDLKFPCFFDTENTKKLYENYLL